MGRVAHPFAGFWRRVGLWNLRLRSSPAAGRVLLACPHVSSDTRIAGRFITLLSLVIVGRNSSAQPRRAASSNRYLNGFGAELLFRPVLLLRRLSETRCSYSPKL
jgi:hypothetical protein